MKIVNLEKFLKLPEGTLYFYYHRELFDLKGIPALLIKGPSIDEDTYQAINPAADISNKTLVVLGDAADTGESFHLDPALETYDGRYDPERLYAIFEEDDHRDLILRLLQGYVNLGFEPFNLSVTAPVGPDDELKEVGVIPIGLPYPKNAQLTEVGREAQAIEKLIEELAFVDFDEKVVA